MTEIILPGTFLLDSDARTVWGYVRAYVDNHTVLHVEVVPTSLQPTEAGKAWAPFFSLTIVEGRIAFRMYGKQSQRQGVVDADGHVTITTLPSELSARVTNPAPDGLLENRPSNVVDIRSGSVGQDPRTPHSEGEGVDPGQRAGRHDGVADPRERDGD